MIGCQDIEAPENAWYKRSGDTAEIGCERNHNTWKLTCEDNVWVGVVGNCSAPGNRVLHVDLNSADARAGSIGNSCRIPTLLVEIAKEEHEDSDLNVL